MLKKSSLHLCSLTTLEIKRGFGCIIPRRKGVWGKGFSEVVQQTALKKYTDSLSIHSDGYFLLLVKGGESILQYTHLVIPSLLIQRGLHNAQ